MSEGVITIPKFVSPKQAIRIACGKLGYGNKMQTMELDLIAWAIEANDKISRKKTMRLVKESRTIKDGVITLCAEDLLVNCVSKNGVPLTYQEDGSCVSCVTNSCRKVCRNGPITFTVDECYITPSPAQEDGTVLEVETYKRVMGKDGYPMIPEVCVSAVAEFVMWTLCFRERDNRSGACEQRWYVLCVQARGLLRTLTQQQLEQIGYTWYVR